MRAGYAMTAAANDVPIFNMQRQPATNPSLTGYVREADKWKKNGLKGISFCGCVMGTQSVWRR
jgi:hypothetical protein